MGTPGTLWAPDESLGRLVAESNEFRVAVGAATPADAMPYIIDEGAMIDTSDFETARVLINLYGGISRQNEGVGNWKTEGAITMCFEYRVTAWGTDQAARKTSRRAFNLWISTVMKQIEAAHDMYAEHQGYNPIALRGFRMTAGPYSVPASEMYPVEENADAHMHNSVLWICEFECEIY